MVSCLSGTDSKMQVFLTSWSSNMSRMYPALVSGLLTTFLLLRSCSSVPFLEEFNIDWARKNIVVDNSTGNVQVSLTYDEGAQFASKRSFLCGSFSVKLKLVQGESAGTVCSFYLTSYDSNHDEIDFEFLGNVSGQPYIMHTNLYANGVGGREQRFYLWFDPTADFHTYSVMWNHYQIIWFVDNTPVRIYKNIEGTYPGSYPFTKGMYVAASIYDASTWATRGGEVPINWNYAPFEIDFRDFNLQGCEVPNGDTYACTSSYSGNWWEGTEFQSLTPSQRNNLKRFQQSYMIYDYCTDKARFYTPPTECAYNSV